MMISPRAPRQRCACGGESGAALRVTVENLLPSPGSAVTASYPWCVRSMVILPKLFGARRVEGEMWKTSSLCDRTIRLVKGGLALMRAGYRKLLRGG